MWYTPTATTKPIAIFVSNETTTVKAGMGVSPFDNFASIRYNNSVFQFFSGVILE